MTAFPKYPAYKDSGVEWLGEVSEHWEVEKARWMFRKLERPVRKDDGIVTCFRDGQVALRSRRREEGYTMAILEQGYQAVRKGELVEHGMDAFAGAIGVSEDDGKCTPEYSVLAPTRPDINNHYFAHLLRVMAARGYIHIICPSVRERAPRFRFPKLQDSRFPIPPRAEQDRIVAFLDEKTAQIDALIAKKQRQIELLDEQKAILINRAVTRGIGNGELGIVNDDAADAASDYSTFTIQNSQFTDSGIPWIGPIPKGWEVKSAKHVCERIIDCKNRTAEVVTQGDYYVLRTSNVKKGELVRDEITRTNLKNFTIWTERGAPQAGDVLFTREAPAGEACVFDGSLPACLGQRMMYFRPDTSQLLPEFLVHAIYFGPSATYIQLKTNGSTVGHLRLPDVCALPVLLPPIQEQKQILDILAATDAAQKKLVQTTQSQIQTLQTLRSILIAHAVTGKIKV